MANDLAKLNRLRENAGKSPLKGWKASQAKLDEAISKLEKEGFKDVVPGADTTAQPKTDDPEVAKSLEKEQPEVKKGKAQLGKGLENEPMARQSRIAVQMEREREKRESKENKKVAKAAAKEEKKAAKKLAKGEVDPKKDPEKAKRQKKHIEDKKKAREGKPAKDKNLNEITVAEIARELDIDPKVARAKLRRHEDKISKLHTKGQDRWTFPKSAAAEIKKILK